MTPPRLPLPLRRRATALALLLAVSACAALPPFAGTGPRSRVAGAALKPLTLDLTPGRLGGAASLGTAPFANAAVQVRRLDDDRLLGSGTTGAYGAFQADLAPVPEPGTPLRVSATREGRTLSALAFAGHAQRQPYRVLQAAPGAAGAFVALNPATTLALAAFLKRIKALSAQLALPQSKAIALNALPFLLDAYEKARRAAEETLVKLVAAASAGGGGTAGAGGAGGGLPDLGNLTPAAEKVLARFLDQLLTAVKPEGEISLPPEVVTAISTPDSPLRQVAETVLTLLNEAAEVVAVEAQQSPTPSASPDDWLAALPAATAALAPEASPSPTPSASAELPSPSPSPTSTPTPSPTPSPTPTAASGGGSGARAPDPAQISFTLPNVDYMLTRVLGNATGGNDAGSSATLAAVRAVSGLALAPDGALYLADPLNHQIRRSFAGGPVERIAGAAAGTSGFLDNVTASVGLLDTPAGLLWDTAAGALLVCDAGNKRVRFLRPGGTIGSLLGGGSTTSSPTTAEAVQLLEPVALAASDTGLLYVADRAGGRVWRLAPDRSVTLVASLTQPSALALDPGRDLLWVGSMDGRVLRVTGAGSGAPSLDISTPVFNQPTHDVLGLATDQLGSLLVLGAVPGGDARLWRVPVDALGRLVPGQTPVAVAGSGATGTISADYAGPLSPAVEARSVRLSVRHPGVLTLDLSAAEATSVRAGQVYLGTSYAAEVTWGQVLRLEPAE